MTKHIPLTNRSSSSKTKGSKNRSMASGCLFDRANSGIKEVMLIWSMWFLSAFFIFAGFNWSYICIPHTPPVSAVCDLVWQCQFHSYYLAKPSLDSHKNKHNTKNTKKFYYQRWAKEFPQHREKWRRRKEENANQCTLSK